MPTSKGARKALFVDLDHDGDLDLLLVGTGRRTVYRNNLDGTFTEATAGFGLAGGADARDAVFGDFDGDGRIDVFVTSARGSDALLHNGGAQRFSDVTATSGLSSNGGSGAAAVGDYNNDGFLDLFVASDERRRAGALAQQGRRHLHSRPPLELAPCRRSARRRDCRRRSWTTTMTGGSISSWPARRGVFLFRNDGTGRFLDRSTLIPDPVRGERGVRDRGLGRR